MSMLGYSLDYLPNARDRIVFAHTPVLCMPRHGELPQPPICQRDYVCASDGFYVRGRHNGLDVVLRLADLALPFGDLAERVYLTSGLIPRSIYTEIEQQVLAHHPNEWAGVVHWHEDEPHYRLNALPDMEQSGAHVSYNPRIIDHSRLVLHVHSHGWHDERFSDIDNKSDRLGFYFAAVFGHCESAATLRVASRLVLDGHHFETAPPWEQE